MTDVEGKITIWIQSGSFKHASDLYIQVRADDEKLWRTDDKDGSTPEWGSHITKHLKGKYEKFVFQLMEKDRFSRDDVIATAQFPIAELLNNRINGQYTMTKADGKIVGAVCVEVAFEPGHVGIKDKLESKLHSRDDVIATAEFHISDLLDDGINGEYEMNDADGNSVGTVNININFESGDVGFFDMFGSMLHKSDD